MTIKDEPMQAIQALGGEVVREVEIAIAIAVDTALAEINKICGDALTAECKLVREGAIEAAFDTWLDRNEQ
jgi:hypothetical protein